MIDKKHAALTKEYFLEVDGKVYKQKIDLSIGIMLWVPGLNAQSMLEKADEAMYRSKKDKSVAIKVYQ